MCPCLKLICGGMLLLSILLLAQSISFRSGSRVVHLGQKIQDTFILTVAHLFWKLLFFFFKKKRSTLNSNSDPAYCISPILGQAVKSHPLIHTDVKDPV